VRESARQQRQRRASQELRRRTSKESKAETSNSSDSVTRMQRRGSDQAEDDAGANHRQRRCARTATARPRSARRCHADSDLTPLLADSVGKTP
jgi:hypothetical protein